MINIQNYFKMLGRQTKKFLEPVKNFSSMSLASAKARRDSINKLSSFRTKLQDIMRKRK